jgi:hypothetical protein
MNPFSYFPIRFWRRIFKHDPQIIILIDEFFLTKGFLVQISNKTIMPYHFLVQISNKTIMPYHFLLIFSH